MLPAGTVSGSSVTSGRDCAQAGDAAAARLAASAVRAIQFLTISLLFISPGTPAPRLARVGPRPLRRPLPSRAISFTSPGVLPPGSKSKQPPAVEEDRHRSVVDGIYLHIGLKLSARHGQP